MIRRDLQVMASLVILCAVSPAVHAQEKKSTVAVSGLFVKLDVNRDGVLTVAEVGPVRKKFFDRLLRLGDTNKDGKLSRAEFIVALKPQPISEPNPVADNPGRRPQPGGLRRGGLSRQLFNQWDRNKNGKLTLSEVPPRIRPRLKPLFDRIGKKELTFDDITRFRRRSVSPQQMRRRVNDLFARLDVNKDGKITLKESPQRLQRIVQGLLKRASKPKDGSLTKPELMRILRSRPQSTPTNVAAFLLRRFDKNRNGSIEKTEAADRLKQNFDRLDLNRDGKLDRRELSRLQRGRRPGKRPAPAPKKN